MKITLKQTVKHGGKYHAPGAIIDCKKDIATALVNAGAAATYAEPVAEVAGAGDDLTLNQ